MRDPLGRIRLIDGLAVRTLTSRIAATDFVAQPVAKRLADAGLLVPFEVVDPVTIHSPRFGFVSFPEEWSDAQLHAAANLTLELSKDVLNDGFELKDASAWNVIFSGTSPVFCDHLSFEAIAAREWWAFGQFCRHFTLPLACSRFRGILAHETFRVHRDGLPHEKARRLLGTRGLFTRLLPVLNTFIKGETPRERPDGAAGGIKDTLHSKVYAYCTASLIGGGRRRRSTVSTRWSEYVADRRHYSVRASEAKTLTVSRWVAQTTPSTVIDLGCNTGEFAKLALDHGAEVIAVDSDHDSVERLFLSHPATRRIHPVIADLSDLTGGRGWMGVEHPGLLQRLSEHADLLMMLALVHHLYFSESIPLDEIAALASRLTKRWLIVELIGPSDPMVQAVALQRRRSHLDFSLSRQIQAFLERFDEIDRCDLPEIQRHLLLLRKRQ